MSPQILSERLHYIHPSVNWWASQAEREEDLREKDQRRCSGFPLAPGRRTYLDDSHLEHIIWVWRICDFPWLLHSSATHAYTMTKTVLSVSCRLPIVSRDGSGWKISAFSYTSHSRIRRKTARYRQTNMLSLKGKQRVSWNMCWCNAEFSVSLVIFIRHKVNICFGRAVNCKDNQVLHRHLKGRRLYKRDLKRSLFCNAK